ncbi:hypothetical protein LX36DRAFT_81239 [Colletotrichum falcatum]|nr:hypothetical protein LX36DRAFT_81239 [Colletotrichum falcatum]
MDEGSGQQPLNESGDANPLPAPSPYRPSPPLMDWKPTGVPNSLSPREVFGGQEPLWSCCTQRVCSRAKSCLFRLAVTSNTLYQSPFFSLHHLKKCDTLCRPTWHSSPSNKTETRPMLFPSPTHTQTNKQTALVLCSRECTQYTQPTQRGQTHPKMVRFLSDCTGALSPHAVDSLLVFSFPVFLPEPGIIVG